MVGLTVNFFLGLFKQGYKDSEYKLIAAYFALGCGLLAFLLDIIHWLKPMWFENKKAE